MAVASLHSFSHHSKDPVSPIQASISSSTNTKPKQSLKLKGLSLTKSLCRRAEAGQMHEALSLFEAANNPDSFLFNVMIRGYTNTGFFQEAIDFYCRMQAAGRRADNFTYPFVIKSCVGLPSYTQGLKAHGRLIKAGLDTDIFICNSLIAFYSKLGLIDSSQRVFDEMPERDAVSWNSMIDGYVRNGEGWQSLLCFREMQEISGVKPDHVGILSAVAACTLEMCWKQGKEIHCHVIRHSLDRDIKVHSSILDMYCKSAHMLYAERLFNRVRLKNVVVWNVLIGGYVLNHRPNDAFLCVAQMQDGHIDPDAVTMVNLLPACEQIASVKAIHNVAIRRGLLPHTVLETTLIDVYGKCRELKSAEMLFDQMADNKSIISWNAMITCYMQNKQHVEALKIFLQLQKGPLGPDFFTISSVTTAYAELASLRHGKQIHSFAVRLGCGKNTYVLNSLINMYARCGDLQASRRVFDSMLCKDIVSWNTIVMAYGVHGHGVSALELFSDMKESGLEPNEASFVSVLSACSLAGLVKEGWIHFNSMQQEYSMVPQIEHYRYMVDLLGRSGDLDLAVDFIGKMPLVPTARIWGSLLTASRNKNNIELAELAADQIFTLEHDNTGCYVLLSSMYADAGRWADVERVRSLMREEGLQKKTARSLVELHSKTCSFVNGDRLHVESSTIHQVSDILSRKIGEESCDHILTFNPLDLAAKKAASPRHHSVRLAVIFGLISSTVGTPILVKKNTRICNHCHNATKLIARYTRREIVVGDTRIYHYFNNGFCSCGDYW